MSSFCLISCEKRKCKSVHLKTSRRNRAAAGHGHTVLLRSDGTVIACGGNNSGQCSIPVWKVLRPVCSGRRCDRRPIASLSAMRFEKCWRAIALRCCIRTLLSLIETAKNNILFTRICARAFCPPRSLFPLSPSLSFSHTHRQRRRHR